MWQKNWQKGKELLSHSLSTQGNQEDAEQEASFLLQGRLPSQETLSLSCQPSSCGQDKPKPRAAEVHVQGETICSSGWDTEALTLRGRKNHKKLVPSSSVPGECEQTHLSAEHNNNHRIREML